jgi:hypothetical protein
MGGSCCALAGLAASNAAAEMLSVKIRYTTPPTQQHDVQRLTELTKGGTALALKTASSRAFLEARDDSATLCCDGSKRVARRTIWAPCLKRSKVGVPGRGSGSCNRRAQRGFAHPWKAGPGTEAVHGRQRRARALRQRRSSHSGGAVAEGSRLTRPAVDADGRDPAPAVVVSATRHSSAPRGIRAEHGFAMTRLPDLLPRMVVVWRPRSLGR